MSHDILLLNGDEAVFLSMVSANPLARCDLLPRRRSSGTVVRCQDYDPPGSPQTRALHDVISRCAVVYDWGDRPAGMHASVTRFLDRRGAGVAVVPSAELKPAIPSDATELNPPGPIEVSAIEPPGSGRTR